MTCSQLRPTTYQQLLEAFLTGGYHFAKFHEVCDLSGAERVVLLRHDIDLSVDYALMMAKREYALAITATYFFQVRSPLYNPFSLRAAAAIATIHGLGHEIALHIDLNLYGAAWQDGLLQELALLTSFYPFANPSIVSFHLPHNIPQLQLFAMPAGVEHTYAPKFFQPSAYFSDSTGCWRYGSPLDTTIIATGKALQLLIHPIWWMEPGADAIETLQCAFLKQQQQLIHQIEAATLLKVG